MIASSRSYAIGMAHFQIAGGGRMLIAVLITYVFLVSGAAGLYWYYDFGNPTTGIPLSAIYTLLMAIQTVVLVIFGGMRVTNAIRTDLSSRMIESHRLMPIPAWRALFGYLFGSTTHAIAFGIINALITLPIGMRSGATFSQVVFAHLILFLFAFFLWSFAAIGTFLYRNVFYIVIAGIVFGTCTQILMVLYMGFPGFALLLSPFIGETVFFSTRAITPTWSHPVAVAAQLGLASIFFVGACRRYRGTYPYLLPIALALGLVAIWGGLTALGIARAQDLQIGSMFWGFRRRGMRAAIEPALQTAQIIAGLATCLVLSLVAQWSLSRRELTRPSWPLRLLTPVAAAALSLLPCWGAYAIERVTKPTPVVVTAVVALCHAFLGYLLFRLLRNFRGPVIAAGTGLVLFACWVLPLLLDVVLVLIIPRDSAATGLGTLATFSPLASIVNAWIPDSDTSPIPGLAWQILLTAGLAALAIFRAQRRPAPPAPAVTAPPPT